MLCDPFSPFSTKSNLFTLNFIPKIRYQSECNSLSALQETSQALSLQMVACEERAAKAEADARIERDWRCALQEKETKHKELISSLQIDIKQLTDEVRVGLNIFFLFKQKFNLNLI